MQKIDQVGEGFLQIRGTWRENAGVPEARPGSGRLTHESNLPGNDVRTVEEASGLNCEEWFNSLLLWITSRSPSDSSVNCLGGLSQASVHCSYTSRCKVINQHSGLIEEPLCPWLVCLEDIPSQAVGSVRPRLNPRSTELIKARDKWRASWRLSRSGQGADSPLAFPVLPGSIFHANF